MEKKMNVSEENVTIANRLADLRDEFANSIDNEFSKLDIDDVYLDIWCDDEPLGEIKYISSGTVYGSGLFHEGCRFDDLDWEIKIKIVDELTEYLGL